MFVCIFLLFSSKEAFDRINSHINSACDEQDKSDEERERGLDKEKKKKEKEDGEDTPDQEYEIRAGGGEGKDSTDGGQTFFLSGMQCRRGLGTRLVLATAL